MVSKGHITKYLETKEAELKNWDQFDVYVEVDDVGQPRIGSRWVCTEKEGHDGMKVRHKARLVVRGFQEAEDPRSDSPTLSKESLKLMMAIAANEGFEIQSLDVKNAYLQGSKIDRTVFVEPPADYKKEGKIFSVTFMKMDIKEIALAIIREVLLIQSL